MTGLGTLRVTETGLVVKTTEAGKGFMYRFGVVGLMCQHFAFGVVTFFDLAQTGLAESPGPIGGFLQEDEVPAESLRPRNRYGV